MPSQSSSSPPSASPITIDTRLPLNDGHSIPQFGFGTCASATCTSSALFALQQGYRHLDTAQIYRNESETGAAISQCGPAHDEIFVCTKLWEDQYTRQDAIASVEASRAKLGVDVIDLYLLHTPRPGPAKRLQSWRGLQDCVRRGWIKSVGVSNWAPTHFEQLMNQKDHVENDRDADGGEGGGEKEADEMIFPAVNQIEFHPWQQQKEIRRYCTENGIVVVAYSPLTQGRRLGDETIVRMAKKYGRTAAQIVLRWCLQKGVVVIPKSDKQERIKENMDVFGWELAEEDVTEIDGLDEGQKGNVGEWDPFAWE